MTAPETISLLNVALPAALPSIVKKSVSARPSVPLSIISLSFAAASIVILPDEVVILTAPSPVDISSAARELTLGAAKEKLPAPSVFKN